MDYAKMKVDELRKTYKELSGESSKVVNSMTKKEILDKIAEIEANNQEALDNIEEENSNIVQNIEVEQNNDSVQPSYGSPQWHDYVMSKFTDDEVVNGSPTCDGCRRVVEELIGPILSCQICDYKQPTKDNFGLTTVQVAVRIVVTNELHPLYRQTIDISEIADVHRGNTPEPYSLFPTSTAATRAEGRALRKVLRLRNTITAEEAFDSTNESSSWAPSSQITTAQVHVIDMMCSRLNINVIKFINSGENQYNSINEISEQVALKMIQELNRYQKKEKEIPEYLIGYDKQWNS